MGNATVSKRSLHMERNVRQLGFCISEPANVLFFNPISFISIDALVALGCPHYQILRIRAIKLLDYFRGISAIRN